MHGLKMFKAARRKSTTIRNGRCTLIWQLLGTAALWLAKAYSTVPTTNISW